MNTDRGFDKQEVYQIRVKGILDRRWSDWFDGFTITPQAGGETLLTGPVADQAALHGLLNKIRDIGLFLLSVQREGIEESSRGKSSEASENVGRTEIPR